jgi:DNA-binding NarL/FixJ family response regulator
LPWVIGKAGRNRKTSGLRPMARFLIIDDHPLFREALNSAITNAYPDAQIAESSSLSEALKCLAENEMFDLALLDLKIPDTEGFFGLLDLRASFPRLPVVVVSGLEDFRIVRDVMSYGAAGFIPKSTRKNELTDAIRKVMEGETYLPHDYEEPEDVLDGDERKDLMEKTSNLTPQQLKVVRMLRDGLLNKQIAYQLGVEETTVKAHVSEILRKLKVYTRTQVVIELAKLNVHDLDKLEGQFNASARS